MTPCCLGAGGISYLVIFATALAPDLDRTTVYRIVSTPLGILGFVGELGLCLWLLLKGARTRQVATAVF